MCKFKRRTNKLVTRAFIVVTVLGAILVLLMGCSVVRWSILETITLVAVIITPPDFEYGITMTEDDIIFEFSENDRRVVKRKTLNIQRENGGYLMLDDGVSIMCIAYNDDVYDLLCRNWD